MRNQARILIPRVKDNTIRTGATAGVDLEGSEDGEFVVMWRDREVESLKVVIDVRVGVDVGAGGVEGVGFGLGGVDGGGVVADCAVGV
jgi:hypothetical protein